MNKWLYFLGLLFLTTCTSQAQIIAPLNIYPHFSELKGVEDYNGNTNLLYRIYSKDQTIYQELINNNINLMNISSHTDSLFQADYSYDYTYFSGGSRSILCYDFWEKDPAKFIVCGVEGYEEGYPFVEKYDMPSNLHWFMGEVNFVGISRQADDLVYCTFTSFTMNDSHILFKSTTGGMAWDTAGIFNAFSLSPFNDKILFALEDGKLFKSFDGGLSKSVVDTIPTNSYGKDANVLVYDKDSNYIYRTVNYYIANSPVNKFFVSDNAGNAYSWEIKFTSPSQIYVSADNSVSGSVYLATGKNIYHSTDFGNTFNLFKSFDRYLVGIYKKPGSSKLYAATDYIIYELDGLALTIIKQIPVDPEVFKFYPLDIGNKWVYRSKLPMGVAGNEFSNSNEVIKDTVLANMKIFKKIKSLTPKWYSWDTSYSYERIDSLTGKVYSWNTNTGNEYQIDDLSMNLGDTINVSRFSYSNTYTLFDSSNVKNLFGLSKENHVYYSPTNSDGYSDSYCLTKDFGLTYHLSIVNVPSSLYNLKGAIIKGVLYGDTLLIILGINDKAPVLPKEFTLSQNYPNPFNPSTKIMFTIPVRQGGVQKTRLVIYDMLGREIAVPINGDKSAGNYELEFDAAKYGLSSGIYFYRLISGNYDKTLKMIYLK